MDSEVSSLLIALEKIWVDELVGWQDGRMVSEHCVVLGELVVWPGSLSNLVDVSGSILVVLLSVNIVGLGELWLNLLLPLCLSDSLCLVIAWSAVLGSVDLGRSDNILVENTVVWLGRFDVWRSVFLIVWSDMW